MPTFQGGNLNTFFNWIHSQVQYPAEAIKKRIQGRVIFNFVIDQTGALTDISILHSPDNSLTDEVLRVLKSTPAGSWTPGKEKGKVVSVKQTLFTDFKISLSYPEPEPEPWYLMAEIMPKFQGGDLNTFSNWVQSQIQYPAEAIKKGIQGRVDVSFTIETTGELNEINVISARDKSLADEAIRILKSKPANSWTPAKKKE